MKTIQKYKISSFRNDERFDYTHFLYKLYFRKHLILKQIFIYFFFCLEKTSICLLKTIFSFFQQKFFNQVFFRCLYELKLLITIRS